MLYVTQGREFCSDYTLPMAYDSVEVLIGSGEALNGYCVVLVTEGSGSVQVGTNSYPVIAPALYCFHDQETFQFISATGLRLQILKFRPAVLNERMEFMLGRDEEVPEGGHSGESAPEEVKTTDYQDLWLMEPFLERTDLYYGGIALDPAAAKHVNELLVSLKDHLTGQYDKYWPCHSRTYFMELLILIRRTFQQSPFTVGTIPRELPETIQQVIKYLHTHYKQKIKLEDLTSTFHVNKTTLNEQFKQATGLSLIAYLSKIRMQMAESLLRNTRVPIAEIMERIGINDDAHFLRSFRKHAGCSPSEYRGRFNWRR